MPAPLVNKPDWFVTDPANRVEPSSGKKTAGYVPSEPLPAQNFNWLMYSISLWIDYLASSAGKSNASVNTTYAVTADDANRLLMIDSSGGSFDLDLPAPADLQESSVYIKDVGGALSTNPVTLDRFNLEEIEGLQADYLLQADFGSWELYSDGVHWHLI